MEKLLIYSLKLAHSQHQVSEFSLVDSTKPGYRRFLALWLIDPHRRIISTANVPPQQADWWIEKKSEAGERHSEVPDSLMSNEEMKRHQESLIEERRGKASHMEGRFNKASYSFCEH